MTRSRSSSTLSPSSTRWSRRRTERPSPSCLCQTCACPIGYALSYPGRMASAFRHDRLVDTRPAGFRSTRPDHLPLSGARLRSRPAGRHRPGLPQWRQRGGGRWLPKRPAALGRYSQSDRSGSRAASVASAPRDVDDVLVPPTPKAGPRLLRQSNASRTNAASGAQEAGSPWLTPPLGLVPRPSLRHGGA